MPTRRALHAGDWRWLRLSLQRAQFKSSSLNPIGVSMTSVRVARMCSARPQVRVICERVYVNEGEGCNERNLILYVLNTGRGQAVVRSAGIWQADGAHAHADVPDLDPEHYGPSVRLPIVLQPGQLIHVWLHREPGDGETVGVVQLRYPWSAMRLLLRTSIVTKTRWLREKRVATLVPDAPHLS